MLRTAPTFQKMLGVRWGGEELKGEGGISEGSGLGSLNDYD